MKPSQALTNLQKTTSVEKALEILKYLVQRRDGLVTKIRLGYKRGMNSGSYSLLRLSSIGLSTYSHCAGDYSSEDMEIPIKAEDDELKQEIVKFDLSPEELEKIRKEIDQAC
jgi:hypothetical protein